jgi:hypothetical protein
MRSPLLFLLLGAIGTAQQLDWSTLDKLASRAAESSLITLDEDKLKLASRFLSGQDLTQDLTKSVISGLKGIYVRTFEFDRPNGFTAADLEPIRRQLTAPGWSSIVSVKERDESSEIWLHSKNGAVAGLAIIAAEREELAVVNIVGPVDLNSLAKLAGNFGIPKDFLGGDRKKPAAPSKSKKEEEDED